MGSRIVLKEGVVKLLSALDAIGVPSGEIDAELIDSIKMTRARFLLHLADVANSGYSKETTIGGRTLKKVLRRAINRL